ncbi:hypothetical protein [Aliikangiella sp. G2MR2-5]|uniref:hypothetical protein n=1 Tax=Aliikangiella sp. G2MR2-5 TaxID=2788943 RepID=UPI0018A972C3|nr:hypothetical protein [Aliikangiella sp. G2MR2-5]
MIAKKLTKLFKLLLGFALFFGQNLVIAEVKVSNLDDFVFGRYSGFGNLQSNDNICINVIPRGRYNVTFWGSGPAGAFEVTNGVDSLAYELKFNNRPRTTGGKKVSPGIPLANQRRASQSLDCPSQLNANISVSFLAQTLQAANPGYYQGTLTLVLAPE